MFRSIVVGCDGSEASYRALELAQQLRDPGGGRLTLVGVFPMERVFAAPLTPVLYTEWLHDQARDALQDAADRLDADVPFDTRAVAAPSAGAGLDDAAATGGADLIVLGPSHRHAFGRLVGRTTVQRLLHGAPCAVAVAAPDQHDRFTPGARIAVAYDGSDEAVHARDLAFGIAAGSGASVRLCGVVEPVVYAPAYAPIVPDPGLTERQQRNAAASLDEAAAAAPPDLEVETALAVGYPPAAVLDLAGDDVALLVAGSRGYGPLRRVLAGSTSGALLTNGRVPVLVTPRQAAGH